MQKKLSLLYEVVAALEDVAGELHVFESGVHEVAATQVPVLFPRLSLLQQLL